MTLAQLNYNPDVLTCIANLSNDEVFTPPELANQMLDDLASAWADANNGADIWCDSSMTFLDPFTKSGVFLREITSRLVNGLADEIPDLTERVDHILTKQVFGIAITNLTALLARRSVYCSKFANGKYSIASSFETDAGNIWFEHTEHTWVNRKKAERVHPTSGAIEKVEVEGTGRCTFCGAAESEYNRSGDLETHAYEFIHTDDIKARLAELFGADVHFDVIIGNPPYQLSDGGGTGSSAGPIYNKFIDQAKRLEPRMLTMVVPSKWFSGGKGLDEFRSEMLGDRRIRHLVDFPDSREAFSGVDVAGGVCFFLWDRDNPGTCIVETRATGTVTVAERTLDQYDVFVRDNRALEITERIGRQGEPGLSGFVSPRSPFNVDPEHENDLEGDLYLYAVGGDKRVARQYVGRSSELVDSWKVLLSKTSSEHAGQTDKSGRRRVLSRIEVMPPGSVCTGSYLVLGPCETQAQAENVSAYLKTRLVRFLVSTVLLTQNITRGSFAFVPMQTWDRTWTDAELYEKYGLTDDEIAFIESQIKPMELGLDLGE